MSHRGVMVACAVLVAGGCAAQPEPAPVPTPSPITSPSSPGATTPSPTARPTAAAVDASGAEGSRTWRWTSEGPTAVHPLAGEFAAVEQRDGTTWYLTCKGGRTSAASVSASAVLTLGPGGLEVVAPKGPVVVRELGPLLAAGWVEREGVRSLRVTPIKQARHWATEMAQDAMWAELVRAVPAAKTPGMRDQLVCHMQFAPDKDGWYLEPDRPAVGYAATVAARCNPGEVADGG